MTIWTFLALLPALIGLSAAAEDTSEPQVRTMIVQQELIMRIPVRPLTGPIEWVERRGPRCIPGAAIRGAALSADGNVDFLLAGRKRVRAELDQDCPGLDFYKGFYLSPEDDGVCAGRDTISSRMGGSCRIERFHRLVPLERQIP